MPAPRSTRSRFFLAPTLAASAGLLTLFSACENASFRSTKQDKKPAQSSPQPAAKNSQPGVVPDCGPQGITNARLLTTSLTANSPNQMVRFEMSLTDCNGQAVPISASNIQFDMDVEIPPSENRPVYFAIEDDNGQFLVPLGQQALQSISGSDMFGNVGNFSHYQTSGSLNVNANSKRIFFSVDMSNHDFRPRSGQPDGEVEVYLKFADTTVTKQRIMVHGSSFE